MLGGLVVGLESRFMLPMAGEDVKWLREHITDFKKLAESGDQDLRMLWTRCEAESFYRGNWRKG